MDEEEIMRFGINQGVNFSNFLWYKARQDAEWLPYAEDVHSLVKMLSLDYAEFLRKHELEVIK